MKPEKISFSKNQKLKAQKRGSRDAEIEFGLLSGQFHHLHKSLKDFTRHPKHKKNKFDDE